MNVVKSYLGDWRKKAVSDEKQYFEDRKRFCEERLAKLREFFATNAKDLADVSIYVTGSYGRKEAREKSDLDLFFISEKHSKKTESFLRYYSFKAVEQLSFPPFTDEGAYLTLHDTESMLKSLGGPEDDYKNFFTARMLLLLESECVFGEKEYNNAIGKILAHYFRDEEGAKGEFRPVFLLNDIVRYWRTICLNYEQGRTKYLDAPSEQAKAKQKSKNKKLKFNRIWLCFSGIIPLLTQEYWTQDDVRTLLKKSPYERLNEACTAKAPSNFQFAAKAYKSFLETSASADAATLEDPGNKIFTEWGNYAEEFRKQIVAIIGKTSQRTMQEYLLV